MQEFDNPLYGEDAADYDEELFSARGKAKACVPATALCADLRTRLPFLRGDSRRRAPPARPAPLLFLRSLKCTPTAAPCARTTNGVNRICLLTPPGSGSRARNRPLVTDYGGGGGGGGDDDELLGGAGGSTLRWVNPAPPSQPALLAAGRACAVVGVYCERVPLLGFTAGPKLVFSGGRAAAPSLTERGLGFRGERWAGRFHGHSPDNFEEDC